MRLSVFSKFFDQKIMTGIDVQPEGVQLVQLRREKSTFALQKIAFLPLEATVFADGKINNWDALTTALYDWVRELNVVGAVTAAALPMHAIKLLRVEENVQDESWLRNHLDQVLPGLGETVAVDYCRFVPKESATLVAIAKQVYLDRYAMCLREAGLNLKIMDVELLGVQRACNVSMNIAILWQQRGRFTLIWQDKMQLLQQLQWPATYGEQVINELSLHLAQHQITQLLFCGLTYYCDLFKKAQNLPCQFHYFSPSFHSNGINVSDCLLAIGLAMHEVPAW